MPTVASAAVSTSEYFPDHTSLPYYILRFIIGHRPSHVFVSFQFSMLPIFTVVSTLKARIEQALLPCMFRYLSAFKTENLPRSK